MPVVTAYDTLGEEGLRHSMLQTHTKVIFLDPSLISKTIGPFKDAKDVQHVIYSTTNEANQKDIDALKDAHPHLHVVSFDDVLKLGQDHPVDATPPSPDDLACIMYTSGSTGTPKGVLIKQKNIVAASKPCAARP